ncbi:unnamed protein product [Rotaria socialis]
MSLENEFALETENNQLKQCRICWDDDKPSDIISPCLCSGGSAYVHRKCLNDWRSENIGGESFKFCDVCKFEFVIETVLSDSKTERQRLLKYHLFAIRDSTVIILMVQTVIIGLAFLLKMIDKTNETLKKLFPHSINGFTVYYLSAFLLLLALSGVIIFIILLCVSGNSSSSHSHVSRSSSLSRCMNTNGFVTGIIINVIICAFIGFFFGIIISVIMIRKIMKHHTSKLWLRQEAEKYVIKDSQGQKKDLEDKILIQIKDIIVRH